MTKRSEEKTDIDKYNDINFLHSDDPSISYNKNTPLLKNICNSNIEINNVSVPCNNTPYDNNFALNDTENVDTIDDIYNLSNTVTNNLVTKQNNVLLATPHNSAVSNNSNSVSHVFINENGSDYENKSDSLSQLQYSFDNEIINNDHSANGINPSDNDSITTEKSCLSIVNWNVNGLLIRMTDPDFCDYLLSFDICILTETFTLPTFDFNMIFSEYVCFHSPAEKLSKMGRCSGGVVICIKKKFQQFIKQIDTNIANVLCVKISKNVFGCYNDVLLIGLYNHDVTSVFYKNKDYDCTLDLVEQFILSQLDTNNRDLDFIVVGDFNARISNWSYVEEDDDNVRHKNDIKYYERNSEDDVVNNFGKKLIQFCTMFDFTPINGLRFFCSDNSYTYVSERGNSVIDYFLSSLSVLSFVKKLYVADRIDTHHMPVVLLIENATPNQNDLDQEKSNNVTERLKWDPEKLNQYLDFMKSPQTSLRLAEAGDEIDVDIDTALSSFMNIILEGSVCMNKKVYFNNNRKNSKPWFDSNCRMAKREANKALRKYRRTRSHSNKFKQAEAYTVYSQLKSSYEKVKKDKRKEYKSQMCSNLVQKRHDENRFWSLMKKLKPKDNKNVSIKIETWKNHFSALLGANVTNQQSTNQTEENIMVDDIPNINENINDNGNDDEHIDYGYDLDDLDHEISEAEVKAAIKNLKNNKAAGLDGVSSEFLKSADDIIVPFLTKLFNKMFDTGYFPEKWCQSVIMPLHKKGDHNNPDNYRGISLINVTSKIFTSIINRRLYNWSENENKICDEQAGFRRHFSTIDQIYTLITIIRKCLFGPRKSKLYVVFVDYMKAFDSVNRNKLWSILKKIKTSQKMLNMLKGIYNQVNCCVRWKSEISEFFDCPLGVKQGCILSPLIFSLFVNEVANVVSSNCKHGFQFRPGLKEICLLLFADDICLFSTSPSGLQHQINNLENASKAIGLKVNLNKTKVMVFRKGGFLSKHEKWYYNGQLLEVVNSYKYLGFTLSTKLSLDMALEEFSGRAKKKIIAITKALYTLGSINVNIFFKLFDAQVKPMLLYASEIWGMSKFAVIESVHLFACKRILNVSGKTPNLMIYGELGRYPLYIDSSVSVIRYYFRVLSLDENRLPKQALCMEKQLMNENVNARCSWIYSVKHCLEMYGFAGIFSGDIAVGNTKLFCKLFKQRMIDGYMQEWHGKLTSSDRFSVYRTFKESLFQENYLSCITITKFRNALIRLRLGINELNVNNRFNDETKLCPFCENIENESHFILRCSKYEPLREKYIWKHFDSHSHPNVVDILKNDNLFVIRDVAMYIFYALKLREDTLATFIC